MIARLRTRLNTRHSLPIYSCKTFFHTEVFATGRCAKTIQQRYCYKERSSSLVTSFVFKEQSIDISLSCSSYVHKMGTWYGTSWRRHHSTCFNSKRKVQKYWNDIFAFQTNAPLECLNTLGLQEVMLSARGTINHKL